MSRIVVMEVPDSETDDNIQIAIALWNDQNPERKIEILTQTGFPTSG